MSICIFRDRSRSVTNLITQLTGVLVTERLCKSVLLSTAEDDDGKREIQVDLDLELDVNP